MWTAVNAAYLHMRRNDIQPGLPRGVRDETGGGHRAWAGDAARVRDRTNVAAVAIRRERHQAHREVRGFRYSLQEISETSNFSMRLMPLSPDSNRRHVCSVPHASGVTSPSPVTTTRLIADTPGQARLNIVAPHMEICGVHGSPHPSCKKYRPATG